MIEDLGISIKPTIGIGDALQFSSVPENYFRTTGRKLCDISRPWFFDHNPFIDRSFRTPPKKVIEMWNFSPKQWQWPKPRPDKPQVYLSNAEIGAKVFGAEVSLNRPRLYQFEDFPFHERQMILLQTEGKSHGVMPSHILDHIIEKYLPTKNLYHIGPEDHRLKGINIPHLITPTLWELAEIISKARMLIGLDSGPSWIAAAYPDVVVKKIRIKPSADIFKDWIPLEIANVHSHWDDRCHQIFNPSDVDVGFTSSYRKI